MRCQVLELDVRVNTALVVKHLWTKLVEAKPSTALPLNSLGDASLFAVDDFHETWLAMRTRVSTHFNANPIASHLVGDRTRGPRTKVTV